MGLYKHYTAMTTIYYGNRAIGAVEGRVFSKSVKRSKHLFRKLNAYGISQSVINELIEKKVETIKVTDVEGRVVYEVSLVDFIKNATPMQYEDMQLFLPLEMWKKL